MKIRWDKKFIFTALLTAFACVFLVACSPSQSSTKFNFGQFIVEIFIGLITYVFVPIILISLLLLSWNIVKLERSNEKQYARRFFAFIAGWVLFVLIVLLSQFTGMFKSLAPVNAFEKIWLYIILGFLLGLGLMAAVHKFNKSLAASILILVITSISATTLYLYVFQGDYKEAILISSVTFLIGALIYIVLFPEIIKTLWKK